MIGRHLVAFLLLVLAAPALAQAPEAATGRAQHHDSFAFRAMVVAANPVAAEAGRTMLRHGGTAIDAAIATQLALNLVEPQSSGLGGGAFLVYWSAKDKRVVTFDGRETAPAAARPDRFLGRDGKPISFYDGVVGGRSVGVPGVLRALALAHQRYGKLPWRDLFQPAIALAEQGFPVSPRLRTLLEKDPYLRRFEPARSYFYDSDGIPKGRLVNRELAATLRLIAEHGPDAFYRGPVAQDIVAAVRNAPVSPGDLSEEDLASYQAKEREPVCGTYRGRRLCGMGPPSSGAVTLLEMLDMLERFDLSRFQPGSEPAVHLLAEAGKLAYADRNRYLADSDFVPVPVRGLLDPAYLADRSRLIEPDRALPVPVAPGDPPGTHARDWRDDASPELHGTSNIAIVDPEGDALDMTTTIENGFGSRLMVRGFLLNNELTDFSFVPEENGKPVANRIEPGKRPRSAMAPTLVFDKDGKPVVVLGSAGGPAIINDVAKTLIALLDQRADLQVAIDLPDDGNRNGATEIEERPGASTIAGALTALGDQVTISNRPSGLTGIVIAPRGLIGAADSRREGAALGD